MSRKYTHLKQHEEEILRMKENGCSRKEIAEKLDISVDDVNMIITKIKRSEHKSKVPESPQKTIL